MDAEQVASYLSTEELAEQLLSRLPGWDRVPRDHKANTPRRFVTMLDYLTTRSEFNFTTFPNDGMDEMIVLSPIPFYALCAHHVIPFFGNAHIGYVPDGKIAGLSKFARAVKSMSRGLWVQEELTKEIADFLNSTLSPRGVAVVLKAEHLCMAMRGVQLPGVITTTSSMKGVFGDHSRTAKAEFLQWIRTHSE